MSEIFPYLFLGDFNNSQSLDFMKNFKITHVLNVTDEINPRFPSLINKQIPVDDLPTVNLLQHFEDAYAFIENARRSGGVVLVHCAAGISRSATIVIAYIIKAYKMQYFDAYKHVKDRREVELGNS